MAVGQPSQAATRQVVDGAAPARRARAADAAARRATVDSPAFINDQAEEHHHLELLRDPQTAPAAKAAARLELARLYERRGDFAEAVEMYERNVWDGARTPATYAGLAAAYRELGRHDLAEAALDQVRRQGGAGRDATVETMVRTAGRRSLPARGRRATFGPAADSRRAPSQRLSRAAAPQFVAPQASRLADSGDVAAGPLGALQRSVAPFLAARAGSATLVISTVLLPVVLGLGIFGAVVVTSTRSRNVEAPAPTPAPVATLAPTVMPTAAPPTPAIPPALSQPPAPPRLVVSNVVDDGLSLRQAPGTGRRIKVWKDGTEMADLGETAEQGGISWRKVRDPEGSVGWVAAEYLADPSARAAPSSGPSFESGGLGLARAEWEKAYGQPTRSSIFLEYDGGRLVVGLLEGNVWHIERVWIRGDAVSLEAAREDVRIYLPRDATLTQSIDRGDGRIIDVYSSSALGKRFGSTAWNGGSVGTFSIQYRFRSPADRLVTSAMFRLGDAQF